MNLGTRKLIGLIAVILVTGVLTGLALVFRPEMDGWEIGGAMSPIVTLFGLFVTGTWMEWRERRMDQSSIADQIRATGEQSGSSPSGAPPS